jgi:hypothetical protein
MGLLNHVNLRLDALETCLLTMNELRKYLILKEEKCCTCFYFRPHNKYDEEISYIDTFLDYLYAQEKHYRKLQKSSQD